MLPIWSLGNGRLIVSMDISMHLPHPTQSFSLSYSPSSCCRCYCCHSPSALHAASHMCEVAYFFRKTFSLLPFKADTFAHFAHRVAASVTATARPHASCFPLPPSCLSLGQSSWLLSTAWLLPPTHLARKRRARINLLNFAAFATVAASVAATASACGMY